MKDRYKKKKVYIECLRIMAILFVIYNHTRTWGFELYRVTEEMNSRWLSIGMLPVCKIAVPLFMMIAGANLMEKQENLKELFQKRVLRYIIIIIVFGTLHFLRYVRSGKTVFSLINWIKAIVSEPVIEPYWFLYLYLGFLLMLPFLRKLAERLEKAEFSYLFGLMTIYNILKAVGWLSGVAVNGNIFILLSVYIFFYPLMGYGIDKYSDQSECRKYGVLSIGALVAAVGLGMVYSRLYPQQNSNFAEVIQTFTPILACGVFGWVKTLCNNKDKYFSKFLETIGSTVFGIYLTEDIIRNQVEKILVRTQISMYVNDFIVALLFVAATFIIGVCSIYVLKRLPILNKLI